MAFHTLQVLGIIPNSSILHEFSFWDIAFPEAEC
jgi:hypothetical protein